MNPKEELEKRRLACGPMSVSVDGVCRRKLEEKYNTLLDRLTHEVHPEPEPESLEDNEKPQENFPGFMNSSGKGSAQGGGALGGVKKAVKEFEEKLMGNSKLLQDPTGKITKHSEKQPGKTKQGTEPKTK
jgi:hypothetical protein